MRPVDVGRLLLSAWQERTLQRRHCLSKDWPCLQAAFFEAVRMLFCFDLLMLQNCVMLESVGRVLLGSGRFELLGINADALRMSRWLGQVQRCRGHFQCDQWTLDDCCSQQGKTKTCIDVTASARIGLIRRRCCKWYACCFVLTC
jgi:hypothetical protein